MSFGYTVEVDIRVMQATAGFYRDYKGSNRELTGKPDSEMGAGFIQGLHRDHYKCPGPRFRI